MIIINYTKAEFLGIYTSGTWSAPIILQI